MEAITITEFRPIFEQQKYKHIGLFTDPQGMQRLIPFNPSTKKPEERLKEIERKLSSAALEDGIYYILAKSSPKADVLPSVYPIKKGNVKPGAVTNIHLSQAQQNGEKKMFTYQEALKMEVENSSLKLENNALKSTIQAHEKDIDNLTNQVDVDAERASEMADNAQPSWQTALADNIVPLLDAIAKDRKEERELEARKLNLQAQHLKFQREKLTNPNRLLRHEQKDESLLWEDLNEDQIAGLDETERMRLFNEWLARYSQTDPEGYREFIKENNLA